MKTTRALVAVATLLCVSGWAGALGWAATPGNLDELVATYGTDIAGSKWQETLKALVAFVEDGDAVAPAKAQTEAGLAAFEKQDSLAATNHFYQAILVLRQMPGGGNLEAIWRAALDSGWRQAGKRDAYVPNGKPEVVITGDKLANLADFDEKIVPWAKQIEAQYGPHRAADFYSAVHDFLMQTERAEEIHRGERSRQEVTLCLVKARLARARVSLHQGITPVSRGMDYLNDVLDMVDLLPDQETQTLLKDETLAMLPELRAALDFELGGRSMGAQLAWSIAQMKRGANDGPGYVAAIAATIALVTRATDLEAKGVKLIRRLGQEMPYNVVLQQLAANANIAQLSILAPNLQNLMPGVLTADVQMAFHAADGLVRAESALENLIILQPEDWTSRLWLAQLVLGSTIPVSDNGVAALPEADQKVIREQVGALMAGGATDPELYLWAGTMLSRANMAGGDGPLKKFVELAPDHPQAAKVKQYLEALKQGR
jgi:hypothetical protein